MKLALLAFVAVFAIAFQAHASSQRLVAQGSCGVSYEGRAGDVRFYGNSSGQVSADLNLDDSVELNDDNSGPSYEAVDLGVLPKMHATGTEVVDNVTGKVCATRKGGRAYHSTHQCTIVVHESHKPCVRNYYLVTK